jgi:hypothetical protein
MPGARRPHTGRRLFHRRTAGTDAERDRWIILVEAADEGPDAAFREIMARIARGDRIRGRAL